MLLVEFAGEESAALLARLEALEELHGRSWGFPESVVRVTDAARQAAVWDVRKAGLNIMMSMKGDGKPVSFIEDCAVPLEHLAEYTERLTASSSATAPAAPGTRTPRSAACTCGRSST